MPLTFPETIIARPNRMTDQAATSIDHMLKKQLAKKNLFSNYLTYNCANNDYTDITYRFVKAIDFIDPANRIRDLVCDPRTLDLGLGTQDPRARDLELQDQGPYQQNKGVIDFTKSPNYLV